MNGYPVGDASMSSTLGPMQKAKVIIIIQPRSPLTAVVSIIDRGIVLLALCNSSDYGNMSVTLTSSILHALMKVSLVLPRWVQNSPYLCRRDVHVSTHHVIVMHYKVFGEKGGTLRIRTICAAASAPNKGKIPDVIPARVLTPKLFQPPPS